MITFNLQEIPQPPKSKFKRNWKLYSKDLLLQKLSQITFNINSEEVQTLWNHFESTLITIVDELVP